MYQEEENNSRHINVDNLRCWRDIHKIGEIFQKIPIQSSFALYAHENIDTSPSNPIYRSLYLPDSCLLYRGIDNEKEELQCSDSDWNVDEITSKILYGIEPQVSQFYCNTSNNIISSLEELILQTSSSIVGTVESQVQPPKNLTNVSIVSAPNKSSNDNGNIKNNLDKNSTDKSLNASTKVSGPFESAKVKFNKDGGKLDIQQKKPMKSVEPSSQSSDDNSDLPPELQHFEKKLVEKIESDIIHTGQPVTFSDIAGLEFAKQCVNEVICWPMSRPDLFVGLRALPKGLLLFGPPGTGKEVYNKIILLNLSFYLTIGKTLIGKAVAYEVGATFFSISSSSLTSKWIGEGEKTVKTLFGVAAYRQPSVIFVDEVDSLLCQRSTDENEASRRMKTEFLVQLDGASTNSSARVVFIGATNRPSELDDAARRRFVKRLYIPLPDEAGRKQLFETLLKGNNHILSSEDIDELVIRTAGYSGADIRNLANEAAMGPVREIAKNNKQLERISVNDVPSIDKHHFYDAFDSVTSSVSQGDLQKYIDWNNEYGSYKRMD